MLPRYRVNSPVKSGETRSAWTRKIASTMTRSTRTGGLGADRMRRVWVARSGRDGHLIHRDAKCDRSETFRDGLGLVALAPTIAASERGQNSGVIGERDRALVIEAQCREGLHRIEEELLGLRQLAALHRAHPLGLREQRAPARVSGPPDDRLDPIEETLVVDPPARGGDDRERSDHRLVDEALGIPGAADGVVARFALPQAVVRRDEVARGDIERAGLRLDEDLAERLLLG